MFFANAVHCPIVERAVCQHVSRQAERQRVDTRLLAGSFSADQPMPFESSHHSIGSDDLQPCIEDIRLEIDRLRREEQLLRGRFVSLTLTLS